RCSVKIRRKPREAREFRDYLEIVEVEYSDAKQSCVFSGAWARNEKATQQIILAVPHSLPESDHADVLANLGEALEKLGYEFVVFKAGPKQTRPEILLKSQAARLEFL